MWRPWAVAAALTAVAVLAAGCSDLAPAAPPAATTQTAAAPGNARLAQACGDAKKAVNDATASFTGRLADAVAANERGDTVARDRAISEVKAVFADWSTALRGQADRADDAELKAVLTEYAGAVDAVISRVHTPADLDKLYTFDDQELDTVASRLASLCG